MLQKFAKSTQHSSQRQGLVLQETPPPFQSEWRIAAGSVSYPGKGECADPVNEDAILERVGGGSPGRNKERQLASDTGDGKT